MRITNKMMTNNVLYNINSNKNSLNKLDEQYSTGLKIQRPSDDPIVAVRALKLRTNLSELNQYFEKNIPDAMSWMESTESAMILTNEIMTKLHTYGVQGSSDTVTDSDRESIIKNLEQLQQQIHQEGNTNYAGRYVFTGYKTDTSLVFSEDTSNLDYIITEKLNGISNIDIIKKVINPCDISEYDPDRPDDFQFEDKSDLVTSYRVRLAYNDLKTMENEGNIIIRIPEVDDEGNYVYDEDGVLQYSEEIEGSELEVMNSNAVDAYKPVEGSINYLEDTGELILSEEKYNEWRRLDFHITYTKDNFKKNDLRPEHYFDSVVMDKTIEEDYDREEAAIVYTKENQEISFEVNFNQRLVINTQGSDAIKHDTGRTVEDMLKATYDVHRLKANITEVTSRLKDDKIEDDQKAKLTEILEVLNTELTLKNEVMQNTFERSLTVIEEQQAILNTALADLGTRYNRLELTESRLSQQQTEFTDLLSSNEDADMVNTIIKFQSMQSIYNASLAAASKVVQNTLLDFM